MEGSWAVSMAAREVRDDRPAGRVVNDRANDEVEGPARGRIDDTAQRCQLMIDSLQPNPFAGLRDEIQ